MVDKTTDDAWERYGQDDPYFGVLTDEKYRRDRLSEADKEEFFRTGSSHVDDMLETIRQHVDPNFEVERALDFGCGVARVVAPLATIATEVTGVDVSDSMLREARKNCDARQLSNVTFLKSDDELSLLTGRFHFIHSCIVFQHIPVERGEKIFRKLLDHLEVGGVAVLQLTYGRAYELGWKDLIKKRMPGLHGIYRVVRGRDPSPALMQMNPYNLNRLFSMMQAARVGQSHVQFTDHDGEYGVVLYFRKPR